MIKPHLFRILTPTALAIALLASLGCSKKPVAASANPFPESNQVQGWTRSDEIRTFPAAELWKYIDGDAEKYLKAGVESTSTSDYKFQDKLGGGRRHLHHVIADRRQDHFRVGALPRRIHSAGW